MILVMIKNILLINITNVIYHKLLKDLINYVTNTVIILDQIIAAIHRR